MYTKGNILYSEPYKYLKHKTRPIVGLAFNLNSFNKEDFDEVELDLPLEVEVNKPLIYWQKHLFSNNPKGNWTYAGIKTSIIKSRYSDDDQMALILNKDNSEEDATLFEMMQGWREFAGEIAKKAMELI